MIYEGDRLKPIKCDLYRAENAQKEGPEVEEMLGMIYSEASTGYSARLSSDSGVIDRIDTISFPGRYVTRVLRVRPFEVTKRFVRPQLTFDSDSEPTAEGIVNKLFSIRSLRNLALVITPKAGLTGKHIVHGFAIDGERHLGVTNLTTDEKNLIVYTQKPDNYSIIYCSGYIELEDAFKKTEIRNRIFEVLQNRPSKGVPISYGGNEITIRYRRWKPHTTRQSLKSKKKPSKGSRNNSKSKSEHIITSTSPDLYDSKTHVVLKNVRKRNTYHSFEACKPSLPHTVIRTRSQANLPSTYLSEVKNLRSQYVIQTDGNRGMLQMAKNARTQLQNDGRRLSKLAEQNKRAMTSAEFMKSEPRLDNPCQPSSLEETPMIKTTKPQSIAPRSFSASKKPTLFRNRTQPSVKHKYNTLKGKVPEPPLIPTENGDSTCTFHKSPSGEAVAAKPSYVIRSRVPLGKENMRNAKLSCHQMLSKMKNLSNNRRVYSVGAKDSCTSQATNTYSRNETTSNLPCEVSEMPIKSRAPSRVSESRPTNATVKAPSSPKNPDLKLRTLMRARSFTPQNDSSFAMCRPIQKYYSNAVLNKPATGNKLFKSQSAINRIFSANCSSAIKNQNLLKKSSAASCTTQEVGERASAQTMDVPQALSMPSSATFARTPQPSWNSSILLTQLAQGNQQQSNDTDTVNKTEELQFSTGMPQVDVENMWVVKEVGRQKSKTSIATSFASMQIASSGENDMLADTDNFDSILSIPSWDVADKQSKNATKVNVEKKRKTIKCGVKMRRKKKVNRDCQDDEPEESPKPKKPTLPPKDSDGVRVLYMPQSLKDSDGEIQMARGCSTPSFENTQSIIRSKSSDFVRLIDPINVPPNFSKRAIEHLHQRLNRITTKQAFDNLDWLVKKINSRPIPQNRQLFTFFKIVEQLDIKMFVRKETYLISRSPTLDQRCRLDCYVFEDRNEFVMSIGLLCKQLNAFIKLCPGIKPNIRYIDNALELTTLPKCLTNFLRTVMIKLHAKKLFKAIAEVIYEMLQPRATLLALSHQAREPDQSKEERLSNDLKNLQELDDALLQLKKQRAAMRD